jgi:xanthine dehydrogenase molybdenum-binding subunit
MHAEDFSAVGQSMPQLNTLVKVTGKAKYTADLNMSGMLYAKVLRSPLPHARILNIDTTRAERLPGVKAVICHKNVPRVAYNSYYREPIDEERLPADEYIFDQKVRYVGDKVAAVAATSLDIAEEALEQIDVEYEELPFVIDPVEALHPDAPQIHDVKNNVVKEVEWHLGNIDEGFAEADYIFENRYRTQMQQHAPLEPHCYIAEFDITGRLHIISSTQGTFNVRVLLGKILKMPLNKIRVTRTHIGGGFGGKNDLFDEILCALLAMKTERPVRLVNTREEEFTSTRVRHCHFIDLRYGVKKDGTFVAREMKALLNTGAYAAAGGKVTLTTGHRWIMLYRTPHVRYEGKCVYCNTPVAAAMRGFGTPQQSFATESMIDEIAEKLDIDPVEIRLKNHRRLGEFDPISKITLGSVGIPDCLTRGAEAIAWAEKRKAVKAHGRYRRGVGVALGTHNTGVKPFVNELSSAFVKVNEDGSINLLTGVVDLGQGSDTVLAQIVAEVLGVHVEDVSLVDPGDTESTPYDMGTHSSRQTYLGGMAVKMAAEEARTQLLEKAAELLEARPEDLEMKDRKIFVKGSPSKNVSLADVSVGLIHGQVTRQVMGRGSFSPVTNAPPFEVHFAEVEVDTETGAVKVTKFVAAHDLGKIINPLLSEGQVQGGVHMGIGYTFWEGLQIDPQTGRCLNADFRDYKVTSSVDMPPLDVILVESQEPTGPFGAKGLGEPAMVPTAPAIANAIYDAIGVRFRQLPITRERVFQAIQKQRVQRSAANPSKS